MSPRLEWLTATPLVYGEAFHFWERDAGLLCLGLRKIGVEARFAALGENSQSSSLHPLIVGRLEDFQDPRWWKQWGAKGVILNAWASPRYEPVARAIKAAGMQLMTRLDSDGCKSPRTQFWRFLAYTRSTAIDDKRPLPTIYALAKTLTFRLFPKAHDRGMLAHLAHADWITIESPLALERYAHLLESLGHPELSPRLHLLPHPTSDEFIHNPQARRECRIVAVGRWDAHQKDGPLLLSVLFRVLGRNPSCRATVVGAMNSKLRDKTSRWPENLRARLELPGRIPNPELQSHYDKSRILLVTSRHESFHIAAAEALCCGCTVVGPAAVPSMHWFTGDSSGTLSPDRTLIGLSAAVEEELAAWESGKREAYPRSRLWRSRVTASAVARKAMEIAAAKSPRPNP